MLKFKEGAVAALIEAAGTVGAKIATTPKVTQAVLNTMQLVKTFASDIKVHSTTDGLIIAKTGDINVESSVLFTDETLVEFSEMLTPDLYHKSNDPKSEFRYYPALRQMMRVRSRSGEDTILADDDHNVFRAPNDIKYISAKQSIIPIFFPKLIKDRAEADQLILESNARRKMTTIKPGDKVILREYSDMKEEFGDNEEPFGYGEETMRVTASIKGADTIVFTNLATHMCGQKFTVKEVLENRQEVVLTTDHTKLVNPVTGEELPNSYALRFSKLHFVKA